MKGSPLAWGMREPSIPISLCEFRSSQVFDGVGNPNHHVTRFTVIMRLRGAQTSEYCQAFKHTLEGPAREWFEGLRPNSINSWRQLSDMFVSSFTLRLNLTEVLGAVWQGKDERIRDYLERFETLRFEDVREDQVMFWVKEGLRRGIPFHVAVSIENTGTWEAFHEISQRYIDFEEGTAQGEDNKGPGGRPPRYPVYTRLTKKRAIILRECAGKELRNRPQPLVHEQERHPSSKWCQYHRSRGHTTGGCQQLRNDIEDLVQSGKLKQYVEEKEEQRVPWEQSRSSPNKGYVTFQTGPS